MPVQKKNPETYWMHPVNGQNLWCYDREQGDYDSCFSQGHKIKLATIVEGNPKAPFSIAYYTKV